MLSFKKILCPVDFSKSSLQAFHYARMFADIFSSELTLLHVSPNISEAYVALLPDFPTMGICDEEDLMGRFNEFVGDWQGKLKKVIRTGTPYSEIMEYASEKNADLIILGAKGHSGLERLFLGTTGEKVIRNSRIPVLSVRQMPKGPPRRILVPTDFSLHGLAVLPMVASIADRFKAEIDLLHVVELGHESGSTQKKLEYEYFESIQERLADQWELPQPLHAFETNKWIRHHAGSAGLGILDFAKDREVDLVAMATHGRTGVKKVLLGSVTEKVIRISPNPVLTVRSEL